MHLHAMLTKQRYISEISGKNIWTYLLTIVLKTHSSNLIPKLINICSHLGVQQFLHFQKKINNTNCITKLNMPRFLQHIKNQGFPGGAVVENLPANAGDTGSSPGLGKAHMPRSSWAREPQLLSLRIWSLCSATREAAIVRGPRTAMRSGPRLPQLEKALAQKRRPNTAIKFKKLIN